jgi:X-X-X-Leu-X-X-Gly heptad repeat protein
MTNTAKDEAEQPVEEAAKPENTLGLSASQVIAGGAAAAVASVIGGHLGLAGSVIGAFILSVISAIALPLFRASLDRSHTLLKRVIPRRGTEAARTTFPQSAVSTPSTVRAASGKVSATPLPPDRPWGNLADVQAAPRRPRRARMAVAGTALIFLVGLGSILGFQSATGMALSSGTSALQSGVSQVVSGSNDNKVVPPTNPKPAAPTAEPSTVPTDPATNPTDQPTPTGTSRPTLSAKPTAPASTNAPAPTSTPHPAVTSAGAVPTK